MESCKAKFFWVCSSSFLFVAASLFQLLASVAYHLVPFGQPQDYCPVDLAISNEVSSARVFIWILHLRSRGV